MSGIVGQNTGRGSGLVKKTAVSADSVTGSEIADNAIDSEHYTDGSIDNAHIADDAIDSEHYAAGSIDNAHLADDAVDSDELAAGAVDTAHIADNQVTLAKMAGGTDGNIISYDASGDPVAIATGSDGQVLTSTGAGSPPAFEAAAGGGKVLQVVSRKSTTETTHNSTTATASNAYVSITPSATSSIILVMTGIPAMSNTSNYKYQFARVECYRDINGGGFSIFYPDSDTYYPQLGYKADGGGNMERMSVNGSCLGSFFDNTHNTTTEITYKIYARNYDSAMGGAAYVSPMGAADADMTAIEIDGS